MDFTNFQSANLDFLGEELKFNKKLKSFPFKTSLSFLPILRYWEDKAQNGNEYEAKMAKDVLEVVTSKKELTAEVVDPLVIEKYQDEINLLLSDSFPRSLDDENIAAAIVPFQFMPFYTSTRFKELIKFSFETFHEITGMSFEQTISFQTISACHEILATYYNIEESLEKPMVFKMKHEETGLESFYKLNIGTKFIDIKSHGELKPLSKKDIKKIFGKFYDLGNWLKNLPPENFEFSGFAIITFTEITNQETISSLKRDLLEKNAIVTEQSLINIQQKLRNILRIPDLRIGIGAFDVNEANGMSMGNTIWNSFIINNDEGLECDSYIDSIYHKVLQTNKPIIVEDLAKVKKKGIIENKILESGINNIIVAPLMGDDDNIDGVFEIGSPNASDLTFASLLAIKDVFPIFSVAIERIMDELHNKIRATIKQHYTAIHPSVDWKFTQSATQYLQDLRDNEDAELGEIVFKDVYPLYGLSDIRGSSSQRNYGIQEDLIEHLSLISKVLKKAKEFNSMPILDELMFRIQNTSVSIRYGLKSGDEINILDFIKSELEPFIESISDWNDEMRDVFEVYKSRLDPNLGIVYNKRKDFEESLTEINDTVSRYLDEQQELAQQMFPHYFEKYKTDGVDYNMYLGQSITNTHKFDDLYLKNFRLWQLKSMVEITRITKQLKSELKVPLETTQLILVYNTPLSIRFRMDEKHFDVDGAYNIRYEIVKKRIDKAYIKDSNERLTQPEKIAIVYSQEKEAEEYKNYIAYLQHIKYIENEVEEVDLEELQGASGLKALRVKVSFPKENDTVKVKSFEEKDELEKILETIEKNPES